MGKRIGSISRQPLNKYPRLFSLNLNFLICAILILGTTIFAHGAEWELGRYRLLNAPSSGPLLQTMRGKSSLVTYSFVGGVGGVAFGLVASPDTGIANKRIELTYNKEKLDGKRLSIRIGKKLYQLSIYDWLLIPIARFADSEYNACVSLFGPKTNQNSYDIIYHPSFKNTLIGLRLLQADILFFDLNETWQLPKFNGITVLGEGEADAHGRHGLIYQSQKAIHTILRSARFDSWVLTDVDVEMYLSLKDGELSISGEPYYYFWTSNVQSIIQERNRLIDQANNLNKAVQIQEYNNLVAQINSLQPRVTEVTGLTDQLKDNMDAVRRFNPIVYSATLTTMRYAALFRYIKKTNHRGWEVFLKKLPPGKVQPTVTTPTRWKRER